ncbi:DDE_3 domain-containing protein [Trichonephila clavipes]|nr:DDE_3 domain-containing protein [Trichonephila clavipes]
MAQRKHLDDFYMVELLDDWNVDVPSWKDPRNVESPRVSTPGFGNDFKIMDLNTIEHVWDIHGRRIAARQLPPTGLPELRMPLLDEWCNIPQDQIDNLILSMSRRCKACIALSGRHTPYYPSY